MSKTINNNKQSLESNKENINYPNNYSERKTNIKKNEKTTNHPSLSLNNNINSKVISTDYLFSTKENETKNNNPNISNNKINDKEKKESKENKDNKENNDNKDDKYITIDDIIGEKCNINIDILRLFYNNYEQSKTSKKKMGIIQSYGVNTYQGIVRHYNEDRVSIIINMNKPKNFNRKWPKISFFGIYDGHGGERCSEYLRDNLHKLICDNNDFFPENIPEAIRVGFIKAENDFLNNYALNPQKEIIDKSGSCALILLIVDKKIFVANVGDSRCLLSMNNGKKYVEVTKDHKPNSPNEIKRIKKYGGSIYQTETVMNNVNNPEVNGKILIGPYRVLPGRLSVSRTIGDAEAKMEKYGGNPNVVISEPEIFFYDMNRDDIDFFILGCDGIYDQLSSNEILDSTWMVINEKEHPFIKQCKDMHDQSGLIVDLIIKSALARKSFDNVTCLFIALKDLGIKCNEENEENIKNNDNKNDIKKNKKDNIVSTPNISPVTSNYIKDQYFQKINMLPRKSDTPLNNNLNENIKRENNKYYFSDYRSTNKKYPNLNNNYKDRNGRLLTITTDININRNNKTISNNRNKNMNNNYITNRFSYSRLNDNPMSYYSKKYQSYSKMPNYPYTYENNRQEGNNNISLNREYLDTKSIQKISEGNINRRTVGAKKINEKSYLNTSNTQIFKPLSNNNGINRNEYRKTLSINNNNSTSLYNINRLNNKVINLSDLHPKKTGHRHLISIQGGKNSNYTTIKKNNLSLNRPYKYQGHILNNNNTNINNTYSSQNSNYIKNQKNNLSLNNIDNINSNSILRNSENNHLSSRMTKSGRQISLNDSITNTNFRLSNQIRKISNSKSNKYMKSLDKNYNYYSHNSNKNNGIKYNNYLITDINDSKRDYLYTSINNNSNENYRYTNFKNNNENNNYINYRYNRIKKIQ